MAEPTTREHRPPARPEAGTTRPALVCAFPRSFAVPLPSGVVGRAWLETLKLPDPEVSGAHFSIVRLPGGTVQIKDAGSRNGTFVDGTRLAPAEGVQLEDGARIRVGGTLFVYRASFGGALNPSPELGAMIGPYGLRELASTVEAWSKRPPATVLILGETGTGKELAAELIAERLGRARPVAINMGAIAAGVFEAQLFGHTAGAFSDAKKASRGVFASADGGAVFLDEIGELPLELQPKLLRLLDNREIQPVGGERPLKVDVLTLAATHRQLDAMVDAGAFRRDLLTRLSMAVVRLPPLRQRPEDLFPILIGLAKARGELLAARDCEVEAVERLLLHDWPGNVRELAAIFARVRLQHPGEGLPLWAVDATLAPTIRGNAAATPQLPASVQSLTRANIDAALGKSGGNESEAARLLGVSRGALRRALGKA